MMYAVVYCSETVAVFSHIEHALAFAHQNLRGPYDYYEIIDIFNMTVIEKYTY